MISIKKLFTPKAGTQCNCNCCCIECNYPCPCCCCDEELSMPKVPNVGTPPVTKMVRDASKNCLKK